MVTAKTIKEVTADIIDSSEHNRKKLAGLLDVDYNTLCRWCNFNLETHAIPPDKLVALYEITKDFRLIEIIAQNAGFVLFPAKLGISKEQIEGLHKLLPVMETLAKTYAMLMNDDIQQLVSSFGQVWSSVKATKIKD